MNIQRHIQRRLLRSACAIGCAASLTGAAGAEVIVGHLSERVGTNIVDLSTFEPNAWHIGDGTNGVTLWASFGTYAPWEESLWFYGSGERGAEFTDTDVAFVPGITDVSLITDASAYLYHDWSLPNPILANEFTPTGEAPEGWIPPPAGTLLLRNIHTGHYGAVVLHDLHSFINHSPFDPQYGVFSAIAEMTWYFQTDGTGDFSSVPAPGAAIALGLMALGGSSRRRRLS